MQISWQGDTNFIIQARSAIIKIINNKIILPSLEISGPGEYESDGVSIDVFNEIIVVETEGIRIAYLDNFNRKLTDADLDRISGAEILLVPIGGKGTLDAQGASEVIEQIDPKIIIPMAYTELTAFSKIEGKLPEPIPKFKINRNNFPEEGREIVILSKT